MEFWGAFVGAIIGVLILGLFVYYSDKKDQ